MKVQLLDYSFETKLADFQVSNGFDWVTCHATVDYDDFINSQESVEPHVWFDMEEAETQKPEWLSPIATTLFNEEFEKNFRKFY